MLQLMGYFVAQTLYLALHWTTQGTPSSGVARILHWGRELESLSFSFPILFPLFLPLEVGPLNTARGSGERCKLPQRGLGRSLSQNRLWCLLALKTDIWWQQF